MVVNSCYGWDSEIVSKVKGCCKETITVLQKSDGMKVRLTVKTGNVLTRKIDYISMFIEPYLTGRHTTL